MGKRLDFLSGKWIDDGYKGKRKSPEADVGRAVDKFLAAHGVYARTIKSDGTKTRDGWRRSAQGKGISDRIGCAQDGRFVAVELKAPGKKRTITPEQYRFLYEIAKRGGIACVADCVEDVARAMKQTNAEILATLEALKPAAEEPQRALNFLDTPFD